MQNDQLIAKVKPDAQVTIDGGRFIRLLTTLARRMPGRWNLWGSIGARRIS